MPSPLIGHPKRLEPFQRFLDFVAKASGPILITGAPGSGKKRIARFVTEKGPLAVAPFFLLSGLRFSEDLWNRAFQTLKDRGTLVLDGVDYLPMILQERFKDWMLGQDTLVGGGKTLPPEWRVVAIGHNPERIWSGLLYRFTYHIHLPSLTEVVEDIPFHVKHFLREKPIRYLRYFFLLKAYFHQWRGNLLELEQCLTQAMAYYNTLAVVNGFQGGDEVFGERHTRFYQDILKGEWWYFPYRFPPGFTEQAARVFNQTDFRAKILKEKWVIPLLPDEPGFLVFDLTDPDFEEKANQVYRLFADYLKKETG